jgi:hypothetical protein
MRPDEALNYSERHSCPLLQDAFYGGIALIRQRQIGFSVAFRQKGLAKNLSDRGVPFSVYV